VANTVLEWHITDMPKMLLFVLSAITVGCSSVPAVQSRSPFALTISVEQFEQEDRWTAKFQPSRPVTRLIFNRQVNRFRAQKWKSLSPEVELKEVDGEEAIVSRSGKPFQDVSFEFASYYDDTPKDYEFFQAFSDGSRVMYTGHFNACPEDEDCNEPIRFRFKGRKGSKIVVLGQVSEWTSDWTETTPRGTYVYFGNIKPLQREHLTAIIDPALPKWLRTRMFELLPKLFSFYAKSTGHALTFKPFIFLNYSIEGKGSRSHGGTLPGLIQMSLKGQGWAKESKEAFVDLARFFAHESAHVWNGQLFPYESSDMWMHEGGADAFSYWALYKLGIVSREGFLDFQSGALAECISMLNNKPLNEVKDDPNFRAHYRCGSMLALVTHGAVRKVNPKHGLFEFWSALFDLAKAEGAKPYFEEMYFSTLRKMSQDPDLPKRFQVLLKGPLGNASSFFAEELRESGIEVRAVTMNLPREYQRKQGRDLVRLLMRQDCEGRHSLTLGGDGIETEGMKECKVFSKALFVTRVGTRPIVSEGALAYDEARSRCKEGGKVSVFARGLASPLNAECPTDMQERNAPLAVMSVPE
jgi:hypothetical protein